MKTKLSRRQFTVAKEFLSELLGTAVLLMFGCGCVAQAVLSKNVNGNMFSINVGWGLGVLMGIIVAGPISGNGNYFTFRKVSRIDYNCKMEQFQNS